ncbi:MAG: HXXEE domain-containing protein [Rhizobiaceae bacterium]|nr:HXXEE domain-containing protein [Rhizobiaceae bacterium]
MTLTQIAWLAVAAYGLHMMEEFFFNWRDWARSVVGLPVDWADFYMTNSIVIVVGIVQAQLASAMPIVALSFAALILINATFFHVFPVIKTGGRFSPGLGTALVLFYPVGIATFLIAAREGVGTSTMIAAFVIGALLMAFPIVMIRLRGLPYFQQK